MTLRDVVGACCGLILALLAPAQAFAVACATESQRKIEIERLNSSVNWFLSVVEEVPEGVARQFRDAAIPREGPAEWWNQLNGAADIFTQHGPATAEAPAPTYTGS